MTDNLDIQFKIDEGKCIKCGLCVNDCPLNIIEMQDYPKIVQDGMKCIRCEHCFSICPTGAISILGDEAIEGENTQFNIDYEELKNDFSRRATRHYKDENLDKSIIEDLCKSALHAPTAKNDMNTLLTVIDNKDKLKAFKNKVYEKVALLEITDKEQAFLKMIVKLWKEEGEDKLFAGAPHMVVASAPRGSHNIISDPVIILSYFEILAAAQDIGTLWNGFLLRILESILPGFKEDLKIPQDHQIGYVMMFGKPVVKYKRAARRNSDNIRCIN